MSDDEFARAMGAYEAALAAYTRAVEACRAHAEALLAAERVIAETYAHVCSLGVVTEGK
jgi:hypothetical protein